ncbi:uncharacterized protein EI90DRAFT_3282342 [Cantharellus anzutake]|uniref:uncharacterized protein n=1 Tax=Cantharellus anzutake TaxID=1750568 RepID=UPI001904B17F|nr:uncharacterized protein EI90DRAFT_3282342 [Cantharellus anzutake]KAF8319818.1 hypothetical protein EI90DRAFT_3282342 [Cantharellus anzutake]
MGNAGSVYMANASGQDIQVIASLSPEWVIIDLLFDAALLVAAFTGLSDIIGAAELPEAIETVADLFQLIKIAGGLLKDTVEIGLHIVEAAQTVIDAVIQNTVTISDGSYQDMRDESVWEQCLSPDGIAGIFGAKTVMVLVMSRDGKRVSLWETGPDDSWIATAEHKIVRSVNGRIWERDPDAGTVEWPGQGPHFPSFCHSY